METNIGNINVFSGPMKCGKSRKKPFGKMDELISNADNVQMMNAICECCKKPNAIYSFCTIKKEGDVLIGDSEYIPLCAECYEKMNNLRLN